MIEHGLFQKPFFKWETIFRKLIENDRKSINEYCRWRWPCFIHRWKRISQHQWSNFVSKRCHSICGNCHHVVSEWIGLSGGSFALLRKMRPEKLVMLGIFVDKNVISKCVNELKSIWGYISEETRSSPLARERTKCSLCERHVKNYTYDSADAITKNSGKAILCLHIDDDTAILRGVWMPTLDEHKVEDQDSSSPGTKLYWLDPI